jgi:hypothetical protein
MRISEISLLENLSIDVPHHQNKTKWRKIHDTHDTMFR